MAKHPLAEFTREEMRGVEQIKRDVVYHREAGVSKNFVRAKVKEVVLLIDRLTHLWIAQSGNKELHLELEKEYDEMLKAGQDEKEEMVSKLTARMSIKDEDYEKQKQERRERRKEEDKLKWIQREKDQEKR